MNAKLRTFIYLSLGIFLLVSNNGCTPKNAALASQDLIKTNSLLWEISGNGLKESSYLYGTIHLIPQADFFLTPATKKAFEKSKRITFEINMKDMTNPAKLFSMFTKVMMKGGKSLKDFVSKEDYQLVQEEFKKTGMPLKMFEKMKPFFLTMLIQDGNSNTGEEEDAAPTKAATTSYEMEFYKMGKKSKKDFGGLETIDFQMGIFDSIPYDKQAQMLIKAIKSKGEGAEEYKKMVELYKNQNISEMNKMSGGEADVEGFEDMILNKRNRTWIPLMGKMMTEKQTFFAVGAGHLGGEKGVVSLLIKEGYKLKPLK
jgi:uncharacterized protein